MRAKSKSAASEQHVFLYQKIARDYARWIWRRLDEEVIHCIPLNRPQIHWFIVIEPPHYRTRNLLRVQKA
jgi:hypothetical protein